MNDDLLSSTVSRMRVDSVASGAVRARWTVVFPRELAAVFELGRARVVVGRGGDVRLLHKTVSRAHAAIEWDEAVGAHRVEDLGSHNGTSVDGQRIHSPIAIRSPAVLRLGDVLAVYERIEHEPSDAHERAVFGRAACLFELRAAISEAARDDAPTLILGETGSGKERVARAIHEASRRGGRWIAVNCAAIAPQLVESQLFGHSKGAFTGATEAREGLFRAAHDGTILLDEIGELPEQLQSKLLRVIEEREVLPVGSAAPVRTTAKVIAATHRDLRAAVAAGSFREDLYGRIALRELVVPPLRARRVDVLDWLDRFSPSAPFELSADAAERALCARWPLNLRAVDRLARLLSARTGATVALADLPPWIDGELARGDQTARETAAPTQRPTPTREEFVAAYEAHHGSVRALAKHFDRDRKQIYRWLEAFGLRDER
ncbi:MAG: sigma 54-interacting transcriptional regulator [Polyangiales bacterium]